MFKCELKERLSINNKKIGKKIDLLLLKNLKNKVGNKCLKEGFIVDDSIEIISTSFGEIKAGHLCNNIYYNVKYVADVFNPGIGLIIPNCKIIKKTKMGLIVESDKKKYPITILISTKHNANNPNFKKYKENQFINVELVGKKYEANSYNMFGIGKIVDDNDYYSTDSDDSDDESTTENSDNDEYNFDDISNNDSLSSNKNYENESNKEKNEFNNDNNE